MTSPWLTAVPSVLDMTGSIGRCVAQARTGATLTTSDPGRASRCSHCRSPPTSAAARDHPLTLVERCSAILTWTRSSSSVGSRQWRTHRGHRAEHTAASGGCRTRVRSKKPKPAQAFPAVDGVGSAARVDASGLWPGKSLTTIEPVGPTCRATWLRTSMDSKVQLWPDRACRAGKDWMHGGAE
jgi:hypothetical protein